MSLFPKHYYGPENAEVFRATSLGEAVEEYIDDFACEGDIDARLRDADPWVVTFLESERVDVDARMFSAENILTRIEEDLADEYGDGEDEGHVPWEDHDREVALKLAQALVDHVVGAYRTWYVEEVDRHEVDIKEYLKQHPEMLDKNEVPV